jgi:ribosomal protein S18 acetylase RimI-like enzyme
MEKGSLSDQIVPLTPDFAPAAAEIHAQGQQGTFLTMLGPAFLQALYSEMAISSHCIGYVALYGDKVVGIVVGTTDSGAIFKDLIWRHGPKLVLPVLGALVRHPSLFPKLIQTLIYPDKVETDPEVGEMLFIGVKSHHRGRGIGGVLFRAMEDALRERGVKFMGMTVDDGDEAANSFHQHNGMIPQYRFMLYGRRMNWYLRPLDDSGMSVDEG